MHSADNVTNPHSSLWGRYYGYSTHPTLFPRIAVSPQTKLDCCTKTLGTSHGITYWETDFSEEVPRLTEGKGVDLIIDLPGQSHFQKNIISAGNDGRIVLLALLSESVCKEVNIAPILFKRLRIEGSTLRSRDLEYQGMLRDKFVELALDAIKEKKMKPSIVKVFSWKDVGPGTILWH